MSVCFISLVMLSAASSLQKAIARFSWEVLMFTDVGSLMLSYSQKQYEDVNYIVMKLSIFVCVCVHAGDLSRVSPCPRPMTAGIGFSSTRQPLVHKKSKTLK